MIDVVRRLAAPASLALAKSWRGDDVLRALHEDFLRKCYLCEKPVTLGGFQVDHREPKGGCPARTYDWTNLFPICPFCNPRRSPRYPAAGLLDPGAGHRLEARLAQAWRPECDQPAVFEAVDPGDTPAVATAAELARIHGDSTLQAVDILDAVRRRLGRVMESQRSLLEGALPEASALRHLEVLRHLSSRGAPFTMLVRSRVHPRFHHLFD